jgi:tRNA threonylcarbamoyladenosine dehydratase
MAPMEPADLFAAVTRLPDAERAHFRGMLERFEQNPQPQSRYAAGPALASAIERVFQNHSELFGRLAQSEREERDTDFAQRFGGVGRLYGAAGLARLRAAHVCIVGVGGVGSWAVEGLARSGVGALTLIDLDDICVTNVNRQLHALDGAIGRPKVEALAERARLISPNCRVETRVEFFTASNAAELLAPRYDVVIDAIDAVTQKALLLAECAQRGLRCVTVGGAGGKRDGTQLRLGDLGESGGDDLLRQVRKRLRRDHGFAGGAGHRYSIRAVWSAERPVFPWADGTCAATPEPGGESMRLDCASGYGTAVFVTAAFGLAAAQEAVGIISDGTARPPA